MVSFLAKMKVKKLRYFKKVPFSCLSTSYLYYFKIPEVRESLLGI